MRSDTSIWHLFRAEPLEAFLKSLQIDLCQENKVYFNYLSYYRLCTPIYLLFLHCQNDKRFFNSNLSIMVNVSFSKLLNSNFLCKIGRCLYGFSGMVRILGRAMAEHIILKALRSKKQVFRFKATKVGLLVSLYSK